MLLSFCKTGKWVLNDGIRLQGTKLHSTIADNSFFNLPVTDYKQQTTSVTGNIGLVYLPSDATKVYVNLSSGFRAPNIDDLARVFESSSSQRRVVMPNADLKPEYTYTADFGVNHAITKKIKLDVSAYYTKFRNGITLAPYLLNGKDSILYNGAMCQVVANTNNNKAFVLGGTAAVTATFNKHFSIFSTISYTKGRYEVDNNKTSSIYQKQPNGKYELVQAKVKTKPLDHIPPMFGKTSVQYNSKLVMLELFAQYNGWKNWMTILLVGKIMSNMPLPMGCHLGLQ